MKKGSIISLIDTLLRDVIFYGSTDKVYVLLILHVDANSIRETVLKHLALKFSFLNERI